jgi:hypothetical protein
MSDEAKQPEQTVDFIVEDKPKKISLRRRQRIAARQAAKHGDMERGLLQAGYSSNPITMRNNIHNLMQNTDFVTVFYQYLDYYHSDLKELAGDGLKKLLKSDNLRDVAKGIELFSKMRGLNAPTKSASVSAKVDLIKLPTDEGE